MLPITSLASRTAVARNCKEAKSLFKLEIGEHESNNFKKKIFLAFSEQPMPAMKLEIKKEQLIFLHSLHFQQPSSVMKL